MNPAASSAQPPVPKGLKPALIGVGSGLTVVAVSLYAFDCESELTMFVVGLFVLGLSMAAMGFAIGKSLGRVLLVFGVTALAGFGVGCIAMVLSLQVICRV